MNRSFAELRQMLVDEPSVGVLDNVLSELKRQGRIVTFQFAVDRLEQHKRGHKIRDNELHEIVDRVKAELDRMQPVEIRGIEGLDNLGFDFLRPGETIVRGGYKMDDDYKAASTIGGMPACPAGKIRRVGYTRKNGTKVRSKCIKDRGAVGRWQTIKRMAGIGPLKKGHLKGVGYDATASATARHEALDKAVARYGRNSTIRKLNAIATYTKRTVPSRSKTYRTDMHYVQKKFA